MCTMINIILSNSYSYLIMSPSQKTKRHTVPSSNANRTRVRSGRSKVMQSIHYIEKTVQPKIVKALRRRAKSIRSPFCTKIVNHIERMMHRDEYASASLELADCLDNPKNDTLENNVAFCKLFKMRGSMHAQQVASNRLTSHNDPRKCM